MARRRDFIRLPAVPGTVVKRVDLAKGFEFQKRRGGRVDIIELKAQDPVGTLKCGCLEASGGACKLTVLGRIALCEEAGCKDCGFIVEVPVPGLVDYFRGVFAQ
jgi:hypothetical protein